jgi:hypothetical protein
MPMAYQPKPTAPRARNTIAQAQTRRDTWLQIAAPVILAVLVVLVLLVLLILPGGAPVRSPLADVALILLLLPTLLLGLLLVALLAGLVYLLALGLQRLPPYFKLAQDFVAKAAGQVQGGVKKASDAVLSVRAGVAAAQRMAADLRALLTFQRRP